MALAARLLLAYQQGGEDDPEAMAGAMLIAADILSRLNPK